MVDSEAADGAAVHVVVETQAGAHSLWERGAHETSTVPAVSWTARLNVHVVTCGKKESKVT